MLEVRGLASGYGRIEVLHGLDLDVAPGEIVAVLGANGAGKTTLVRTLAGQLPVREGTITFDGEDITASPAHNRARRGLLMVPEGRRLFGGLSVAENIALGRRAVGRRGGDDPLAELEDLFPIIRERSHQQAGLLSGGEQQQVAFARALVGRPRVLLLDEPSLGLSPLLVDQLFEHIVAIRERLELGIVLVEQMVHRALAVAARAYVVDRGRVVLAGDSATIAASEEVQHAYLGVAPAVADDPAD
ncbi:ABC transporter ATP-binding protein [Nitriliruptoraceae bacterium ZYF776]|nr:ABC transporter ATP-binding protein [Profundirhabdus halotolerans]